MRADVGNVEKGTGAFPIWRCSLDHVNDPLSGKCRVCKESRPCRFCGERPARLYVNGMCCDGCEVIAPTTFVPRAICGRTRVEEKQTKILAAYRPARRVDLTVGIRALVAHCVKEGIPYETASGLSVEELRSVVFRAMTPYGVVFVAYEDRKLARALGPSIEGKGNLSDAKRALGMRVAERKPRAKREAVVKPAAGKQDTMR